MPLKSADARFDRLAETIFRSLTDLSPIEATCLGLHGPNDSRLPIRSESAAEAELSLYRECLAELSGFREKDLSVERVVDLRLARRGLHARTHRLQKHPAWKKCPKTYIDDIVSGLYTLVIREYAPIPKRARAMLGRLKETPGHLDRARENLENPSPIFTESAAAGARGAIVLFDTTIEALIDSVDDPKLAGSLRKASLIARRAVQKRGEWLGERVAPHTHELCAPSVGQMRAFDTCGVWLGQLEGPEAIRGGGRGRCVPSADDTDQIAQQCDRRLRV